MTVGELIDELRKHPVDAHVMIREFDGHGGAFDGDVTTIVADENKLTTQKFVILS